MTDKETQQQRWAQIRTLVEESLGSVGLDAAVWQDVKDAVSKHQAKESAGPLFDSFEARFLKEGIAPEKAREMAKTASELRRQY